MNIERFMVRNGSWSDQVAKTHIAPWMVGQRRVFHPQTGVTHTTRLTADYGDIGSLEVELVGFHWFESENQIIEQLTADEIRELLSLVERHSYARGKSVALERAEA